MSGDKYMVENVKFDLLILKEFETKLNQNGNRKYLHKQMLRYLYTKEEYADITKIINYSKAIRQELSKISIILKRIEETSGEVSQNQLFTTDPKAAMIALDVDLFLIKYRTIIDYLIEVIKLNYYNELTSNKLKDIFNFLKNIDSSNPLVDSEWFFDIADYRNSIVHRGANSVVFLMNGEIAFQIYDINLDNIVFDDYIVQTDETINFKYFFIIYISYLYHFIEGIYSLMNIDSGNEVEKFEIENIGNLDNTDIYMEWLAKCKTKLNSYIY
jgi:hypothetical protein